MIIDIIIVALFLGAAAVGYNKGGLKLIASFGTFIIAFVAAYLLANTTGMALKKTEIGATAAKTVKTSLINVLDLTKGENPVSDVVNDIASNMPVGGDIIGKIVKKINKELQASSVSLANKIVNYLFIGIGFMLIFITAKVVLSIAFFILELIFELPLLKEMNKLVGLGIESAFMLIKIWMVFGLISFMSPIDFMAKTVKLLNDTVLAKMIYDNNWLLSFIISIL
ncbi:MAG: CvpA family protein [Clostridia bacterium]|nr:CvpA family protein [Clostridia bacterium]